MKRLAFPLLASAICALAGCNETPRGGSEIPPHLREGVVVQVGDFEVFGSLVARCAEVHVESPQKALARLVEDALAAKGALRDGLDHNAEVAFEIDAAAARRFVLAAHEQARAMGRITPKELEDMTQARWLEVDLPEQVRVIHAVVLRAKDRDAQADDEGPRLAQQIADQVRSAKSPAEFEERAKAQPAGSREVKVESLPPFVADGRVAVGGTDSRMDLDFSRAAFELSEGDSTSGVVATAFGWHVIRLLERLPAKTVPVADRERLFENDVYAARARTRIREVLEGARNRTRIEMNGAADTLIAGIAVLTP